MSETIICPNCGAQNAYYEKKCFRCGFVLVEDSTNTSETEIQQPINNIQLSKTKKYPALRTIASVFKVSAIIIGLITFVLFLTSFVGIKNGSDSAFYILLSVIVVGGLLTLFCLAVSELIIILVDVATDVHSQLELQIKNQNTK